MYAIRSYYERYQDAVALRERLVAQARDRLGDQPEKLAEFNGLHDMARHYLTLTEDHNFWIDQQGVCVQRVPVLEAGRRLVNAGRIAAAQDVFQLYYDELQGALRGENGNLHELVVQRRLEREHFKKITPPRITSYNVCYTKLLRSLPQPLRIVQGEDYARRSRHLAS